MNDMTSNIFNDLLNLNEKISEIVMIEWVKSQQKQTNKFYSHLEYDFFTGKEPILRINEYKS